MPKLHQKALRVCRHVDTDVAWPISGLGFGLSKVAEGPRRRGPEGLPIAELQEWVEWEKWEGGVNAWA